MKRIAGGKKNKQGIAKVRLGKNRVQVIFEDDQKNPYDIDRDNCPSYVKAGQFFVTLNGDDDRIAGMRPVFANAKAKYIRFASKEDEPPAPMQMPGGTAKRKDGTSFTYPAYLAFTAILSIQDEEYKGMEVPVFLRYLFVDDGEGYVAIKGGGKNADMLEGFMEVTGVYDLNLKFSDNILPSLQKQILKRAEKFGILLKNGYVDSFYELPEEDGDDLDDDDLDDEPFEDDEEDDLDDDSPIEDAEEELDEEGVI